MQACTNVESIGRAENEVVQVQLYKLAFFFMHTPTIDTAANMGLFYWMRGVR